MEGEDGRAMKVGVRGRMGVGVGGWKDDVGCV